MHRNRWYSMSGLLGAAALVLLPACQNPQSMAKVQETLTQINDQQKEILAKLGKLEEQVAKGGGGKPGANQGPRPGQPDPASTYKVPLADAYFKGPATAKVTIITWSDFQCPYCKRVNPTMEQIEKEYGEQVRVAFKHNPLPMHNRALPAAQAAEAAGRQGKFWEMHDLLFENARDLTDENFAKWAGELKLDVEKFKKDLEDPAIKKKIEEQQKEGSTLGARGTPAFFVNGRFLSGAQPFDAFKALIDEEMKKADKLLAAGTPADKVYDKVIENGKTKA